MKVKAKNIITVLFIVVSAYLYHNFIINISPSEPLGIYQIHRIHGIKKTNQIHRGDIVAVCLSSKYQDLGLKQDYLLSGIRCGKTAPLIKTVIAVPGDTVILKDHQIIVNNQVYAYATRYSDSHGRKLAVFPRGFYKNTKQYWLIGVNDPNSWDSRYWGGVEQKQILFSIKPVCYAWHKFL